MSESSNLAVEMEPVNRSRADLYDQASTIAVAGYAVAVMVALALSLTSGQPTTYAIQTNILWARWATLLPITMAGFVTIFDLPGSKWGRNLAAAAVLQLSVPVVTAIAWLSRGGDSVVGVFGATSIAPGIVLAIFTISTVRNRSWMGRSPALAIAGLLFATIVTALTAPLAYTQWLEPAEAIAAALSSLGSPSLLVVAALLVAHRQSRHLAALLRSFVLVASLASAVALIVELTIGEADIFGAYLVSSLPQSIAVLALVAAVAHVLAPPTERSTVIGLGSTIATGALLFWPMGIIATSLACQAMAAAENGDALRATRLATRARTWRAWSIGIGTALLMLVLVTTR